MSRIFSTIPLLVWLTVSSASAGEGQLKGYMFGDYYWVASAAAAAKVPEKRNGFQFRRIYLTYDKEIKEDFAIRMRLEAKDAGFGSGAPMTPFVKNGYLKWKEGLAGSDLYIGLSGTPTWSTVEKVWGYRAVSKTVLDLNKLGSSADLGVGLKGAVSTLKYHLMVGNGTGQRSENDNGKKFYGSANLKTGGVLLEGYADFDMLPADKNKMTLKGLAGVRNEHLHGGVEVFMRINGKAGVAKKAGKDVTITGVSAFGALGLRDGLKGLGRVDMVSNNDLDTTDMLIIAGLDYMPAENVHLIPNVLIDMKDGDPSPDPSIQPRITFYYKY